MFWELLLGPESDAEVPSKEYVPTVRPSAGTRPPRFLNANEAAAFLGHVNSRTITRWAREGYIPAIPIGEGKRRLWRFLQADLHQWMLARRTGTLALAIGAPIRENS